jgi:hypothetical protein
MSNKEWIKANYEKDWDDDNLYFTVTPDGKIIKYDLLSGARYEYYIERVTH